MTESGQGGHGGHGGQGGSPQAGAPWGPPMPAQPDAQPEYPHDRPSDGRPVDVGSAYGYPAPEGPAYGSPQGHVLGPGYEGPGQPHGYGYPPLPEAVTQYIPPIPAAPAHEDPATQYIAPVPAAPAHEEAATQFIAPVPAGPAHEEAATQYLPPVPSAPADPAAGFDGLFRGDTQHLPPVQEPALRRQPPRQYPPQQPSRPQQQFQQPQQAQQFQQQPQPFQQPQQPQYQQQPQQGFQQQGHPQQQFPQQAQQFAPPEEPAARRVSPAIIAAVVIGLAVVGLGVGAVLSDGKAQNNDPGAQAGTPTAGSTAKTAGEAPLDPAQPQAVQLDKLLADSNDSRASVIKAVEDIKGCRNLDQAANDLRDAARQREELVTRLQELKVDQLPDNAKLSAALTKAWKSSAEADNSYAAWADDLKADGEKCKDGKAQSTGNDGAGNKASGEATKAKESAAGMWNSIAGKYNLTKRDKSQL